MVRDSTRAKKLSECEKEENEKIRTIHFLESQKERKSDSGLVQASKKLCVMVLCSLNKMWTCDNICSLFGKPISFHKYDDFTAESHC